MDGLEQKVIISVGVDTGEATAGIEELGDQFKKINNTPIDAPVKNFKQLLKEANNEAQKLRIQFGENSKAAQDAAKNVAKLKDEFDEYKQAVASFNPDNKLQAITGIAKGATGAIGGVTGAMAFLGVESDKASVTIAKLQGLMAFSDALNSVDDIKNSFKNFGAVIQSSSAFQSVNNGLNKAAAGIMTLFGGSVDTTSVAFKGLKGAIAATGIGLLVIGIVALIQNFDKLKVSLGFASKEQEEFNAASKEAFKGGAEASAKVVQSVNDVRNAFALAEKGVISKKEALKKYNDTLGDAFGRTKDLKKAEKELADKADAYIQMTILKAQANEFFTKAAQESTKQLTIQNEDQTSWLDKAKAGLQSYIGDISGSANTLIQAQREGEKEGIDSSKRLQKQYEDQGKIFLEKVNKIASSSKIRTDDQQALDKELKADAEKAKAKAEAQRKALADERAKFKAHLDELKQISEAGELEIANAKVSERQKELNDIDAAAKAVNDKVKKNYDEELASLKEALHKKVITKAEFNDKVGQLDTASEKANTSNLEGSQAKRLEVEKKYNKIVGDFINDYQQTAYEKSRAKLISDFDEKIKVADEKSKEVLEKLKASELDKLDKTETLRKNTINSETTFVDVKSANTIDEHDTPEQRLSKLQAVHDAEKSFKEAQFQEELAKLGNDQDAIRNLKAKHQAEVTDDEKAYSESRKEIHKMETEQKVAELKTIGDATNTLADIVGKQTVAGKALAIATALINTYQGASEVIKAKSTLPEPFGTIQKIASVAAIVSAGIKNVKAITAVQVPAKGGGGGGAGSAPTPTAPTINATALDPSQTQVKDVRVVNGQEQTVKAYIVDRDLQDHQDKQAFLNKYQTL